MLKYLILGFGVLAFCITIPCITMMPPERFIFGVLNPAEACLLVSVAFISLGLTLQALSINPGGNTLARVVEKYGDEWFHNHRVTRGIGLALGGLSHIAAEVLGDEMDSIGGQMPSRTWTINDVLGKLGLRSIAGGDVGLVTAVASKKMEGPILAWRMHLTLLDAQSADLFAKAVEEQTQH